MKTVDGGVARLHVAQAGPQGAPPLVLLHGLGGSGEDWFWQRDDLVRAGYRLLMVDARGHGCSEKPYGRYRIEDMAADVAHALDELAVMRADVCGLSLGGAMALALALEHSDRVRRLVVVNAAACFLPRDLSRLVYYGARLLALSFVGLPRQAHIVANRVFPRPEHAHLREMLYERLTTNDPRAYRRTIGALGRFDVRARLRELGAPTLVVAGEEDTTVALRDKVALADNVPNARLAVVSRSGHAPIADCPQVFNRLLLDFLAEEGIDRDRQVIHSRLSGSHSR